MEAHRRGGLAEAEAMYSQVLQAQSDHFEARHLLGVLRGQQGRLGEALELVGAALTAKPDSVAALSNQGLILQEMRRHQEALASFEKALSLCPDDAEALSNRGNVLSELGRYQEALASYDRAVAIRPNYAEALNNRGIALSALDRHQDAMVSFARALANRPGYAEPLHNLGNALSALGRRDEALASFDRALSIRPDYAEAHCSRANLLAELKRHDQALASYQRALRIRPANADALYNYGNVLAELKRYEAALAAYDSALAIKPDYARTLENRGNVLSKLKRYAEALASYEAALAIDPDSARALTNRGTALKNLGAYDEALASYDRALALSPDHADALFGRGNALKEIKRYDEAIASYERALAIRRDHPDAFGWADAALAICDWPRTEGLVRAVEAELARGTPVVTPFSLLGFCDDAALQLKCAQCYVEDMMPGRPPSPLAVARSGDRKLRVAYLSSDFQGHAVAYLMAEPDRAAKCDRSRFDIVGVSIGPPDDGVMRRRLAGAFDQFHDVHTIGDREVARLIEDRRVDIAVDLNGYTHHARPEILGVRPAPVQVNFLGFPGTMGTDFIDYIIADPIVVPFDQQPFFAEKIVHLPDCYQPNDSKRRVADDTPTRAQAGLPGEGFVFCCFNNNYKITPWMFDIWMRLLGGVPGSVLWLLRDTPGAQSNLRAQAQARGIAPDRLVFAERSSHDAHLARHRLADLFLDTLPYNAHTTASDALWTGLPVLTCQGRAFAGRVASSLLHAVGLPDLVTCSLAEYEAAALRLATDRSLLGTLRERLQEARRKVPLFDADRFRRHLESAYMTMWEIWQAGEPPRSFSVAPLGPSGY